MNELQKGPNGFYVINRADNEAERGLFWKPFNMEKREKAALQEYAARSFSRDGEKKTPGFKPAESPTLRKVFKGENFLK